MLPKATIVALKGLLAWSNFISSTGMNAHCIIILRTRNDLVFQLIISEWGGCYINININK